MCRHDCTRATGHMGSEPGPGDGGKASGSLRCQGEDTVVSLARAPRPIQRVVRAAGGQAQSCSYLLWPEHPRPDSKATRLGQEAGGVPAHTLPGHRSRAKHQKQRPKEAATRDKGRRSSDRQAQQRKEDLAAPAQLTPPGWCCPLVGSSGNVTETRGLLVRHE